MKKYFNTLTFLCISLFIFSCGGDDTPAIPVPVADFSFTIEGKTATFTNASTDAVSHLWDFGDGNTSTEVSPVHTYEGNGSKVAKLSVTNESGTNEKQAVLEIINVGIDGSFDDWSDIEASITPSIGTITAIKVENLENNKLFLYIEGTNELTPLTQIMFDVDNSKGTGAGIDWYYFEGGEDLIIEGSLAAGEEQSGSIFPCSPCDGSNPGNWNWGDPINEDVTSFAKASEMTSIPGGFAYELEIDLTALGQTISPDAIGIAVLDVSLDSWAAVGAAPDFVNAETNPEGTLFHYTFK